MVAGCAARRPRRILPVPAFQRSSAVLRFAKTNAFLFAVLLCAGTSVACTSSLPFGVGSSTPSASDVESVTPVPTVTPTPTEIPPPPPPRHVIGVVMADSGPLAPVERPVTAAIEFAMELVNQQGGLLGRDVSVRIVDSGSTFSGSSEGAKILIEDGATALFVSCDESIASAAIDVANAAGVVTMSPCGSGESWLDESFGPLSFSFGHRWAAEGEVMAEIALANEWDTAFVVIDQSSIEAGQTCDGFFRRYEELGGVLISDPLRYTFEHLSVVKDNLKVNDAARAAKVAVVCSYMPGSLVGGPELLQALREGGVEAPFLAGSLLDGEEWTRVIADLGTMVLATPASVHGDDPNPAVNQVFDAIDDGTGLLNRGWAIEGADAAVAWALAVERAGGTDPTAVAGQLEAFRAEQLISRTVTFSATQHSSPVTELRVVRYDGIGFQYVAKLPVS